MPGCYHFGCFRLEPAERRLWKNREPISLAPKVFDTLVVLVEHRGRLLEKTNLMEKLWPDVAVEEVNLARNVSDLRKILGDGIGGARYIETVPKRGYRFIAEVMTTAPGLAAGGVDRVSVGRDEELARLREAYASVSAGRGAMLTIRGEAGMGKTTVAEDFLSESERLGAVWIGRGRGSERLSETDAFVPIFESLDRLLRGETGDQAARLMKAIAPTWYRQVGPPGEPEVSARDASHERMRRELVSFFEELSRTRPVVLFLDDLHWVDASTCDLLSYLGARIRAIRMLILMTYRPGGIVARRHPFLPMKVDLERRGVCQELQLIWLTQDDIERYLLRRYPGHQFPEEFTQVVYERTEGNPLFMTDMLRYLQERGMLMEQDDKWLLTQPVGEVRQLIPAGIRNMIRLELDQLDQESLELLFCAAVQGMEFDSAVLAEVVARDAAAVEERLQEMETAHQFVRKMGERESANHTFSVRYRFVHVFYQNALYSSLAPSRRVALSNAIAGSLLRRAGEATRAIAADLALLFEAGRNYSSASQYFLVAARNAAHVFAYPEAAILCERGLRALERIPESRERDRQELKFSLTLGMSLMVTRGYSVPEVARTHGRSRELCLKLHDRRRLLSALWGQHTCEINSGELARALQVAREMREVADALADPIAIIESLHALGTTLAFMGRCAEAREALESVFAGYSVDTHVFHGSLYVLDPCVTSLSMLGRLLALMGYLDQAMVQAKSSVELANRLGHPPSLTYAVFWVGWIQHMRGEYGEGLRHLESSMTLSREQGLPLFLEWGRILRGSSLARMGRVAEGVSEIRKAIAHQDAMHSMLERGFCLTLLAESLLRQGALSEALQLCDEAVAFACRTEGRCYEPETHRVRGEILSSLGDDKRLVEAEREFESACELAKQSQSRLLELRAAISQFRLSRRLAGEVVDRKTLAEAAGWFREGIDTPVVLEARDLLGR